ncbi:GAF domain-containing protein [Reyranella sp.]|uniref:GAF domain-containing protein n=1 Tax=Reyranella sp. TaxID=1929291 RepID=UPI003BA94B02
MDETKATGTGRLLDRSRWLFAAFAFGTIVYTLVGAWLVTRGPADPVAHTAAFLAHLVSPWMLATYVVAAAFMAYVAWYLGRPPRHAVKERPIAATMRRTALQFAMVLALAAVTLAGIAWLYVRDLDATSQSERATRQDVVARLKAQQIDKWLVEGTVDTGLLARSLAHMPLDRLPGDLDVRRVVELVFADALAANPDRVAATLFAPDGAVLVHVGAGAAPDRPMAEAARGLAGAPATAPRIVDVYKDDGTPSRVHMGFLAPVAGSDAARPLAAVLAITVDPFRGLLEQVQAWPTPSPSSEVMVVRRDGDHLVFITPPRLTPVPPPDTYRVPLATSERSTAQAMRQGGGVHSGRDYRGVEVLTASVPVKGLPWLVVAKTEEDEFSAPLRRRTLTLALVIGGAVLLATVMLVVMWGEGRAALLAYQQHAEAEHAALSEHFAQLTQVARNIVLMIDSQGHVIAADQAAFDAGGRVAGKPNGQVFTHDIGDRTALEREIARMSQVRAALQAATRVVLRAGSEEAILRGVCEALVRLGGYGGAFVGVPNEDAARSVRLVARVGVDEGFAARAGLTGNDGPRGEGTTARALRTGEVQVDQDAASNPRMKPWRQEALERGFLSAIGLPLKVDGRVFGALTLFAGAPDAFERDETILLSVLADDIGFAVARLRPQSVHRSGSE